MKRVDQKLHFSRFVKEKDGLLLFSFSEGFYKIKKIKHIKKICSCKVDVLKGLKLKYKYIDS